MPVFFLKQNRRGSRYCDFIETIRVQKKTTRPDLGNASVSQCVLDEDIYS
jgi:hypothetical protein